MIELLFFSGVLGVVAWSSYQIGYARAKHDIACWRSHKETNT